jgi:hypothetical protein
MVVFSGMIRLLSLDLLITGKSSHGYIMYSHGLKLIDVLQGC